MRSNLFKRRLEQVNITKTNFVLCILWMLSVDSTSVKCLEPNRTGPVLWNQIKIYGLSLRPKRYFLSTAAISHLTLNVPF